jgi:hypothetical protein
LKNYSNDTGARNAVLVKWKNGKIGEYKIGASGKVDVKYIEPGVGFSYYRDHLYVPGKQHETNNLPSCYRFSCYYRFSDIAINSVNPPFI